MNPVFNPCSKCGGLVAIGAQACPHCGARVDVEPTAAEQPLELDLARSVALDCPSCKKRVESPVDWCPHCGGKLPRESVAVSGAETEACPECGAPVARNLARCSCGASMLVNVVADGPVRETAAAYTIAKSLNALGPPAPSFAEIKAQLERDKPILIRACSRAFARPAIAQLAEKGLRCRAEPVKEPVAPAEPRRSGRAKLVLLALLLVAVAAASALQLSGRVDLLSRFASKPKVLPPSPPPVDNSKQVAAKGLPSSAAIRCASSIGAGFFVAEDLLITNRHVVCPVGETMSIKLHDGRELLGQVKKMDDRLDLALVHVLGAAATPLPVGDAGRLAVGDKVTFIGAPEGFEFTVHEAAVSYLGRNILGLAYVQFDGNVNPGNSGGPLLSSDGKVVGVVSMKVVGAEGLGLALPINYATSGDEPIWAQPGTDSPEWKSVVDKVEKADEEERKKAATAFTKPGLVFAKVLPGRGAVAVLLLRSKVPPPGIDASFKVRFGNADRCQDVQHISIWESLEGVQDANATGSRWVRWLRQHKLSSDLYVGVAQLKPRCFPRDVAGSNLVLEGADEGASSVNLQ